MFMLILTIATYQGPAVTSVPGFDTQKSCIIAGNAWIRQNANNHKHAPDYIRALCVKTK